MDKSKVIFTYALYFFSVATAIICITYSNALFLSTYPNTLLPYLFVAQAISDGLIAYLISPFLAKSIHSHSLYLQSAFLIILFIFICLQFLNINFYLFAFIFTVFLMSMGTLNVLLAWSNIRNTFDIIEFKQIGSRILAVGTIGNIIVSGLIYLFLKKINIDILPYIIGLSLLLSIAGLYNIKPLPTIIKKFKTLEYSPFHNTLFRILFICFFLAIMSFTLIDYCFRQQLGLIHDAQQIGKFTAGFLTVTSILTLLTNLVASRFVLAYLGIGGLFLIISYYWIATGFLALAYPSLWTIVFMAAGKDIFNYSTVNLGREFILNSLPPQLRVKAQFQLSSIAITLSKGISALFIFLFALALGTRFIVCCIILVNLVFIFFARKIGDLYKKNLKQEMQFKRFDISNAPLNLSKEIALNSLTSKNNNEIYFALVLLNKMDLQEMPKVFFKLINSASVEIRIEVIKKIKYSCIASAIPLILYRLEKETSSEVRWWLFDCIITLQPKKVLENIKQYICDSQPVNRAGAIRLLLASGNQQDILLANHLFQKMLHDKDSNVRFYAAQIIAEVHPNNIIEELTILVADSDHRISSNAINVIAQLKLEELIPNIVERLILGGIFYSAKTALSTFGLKSLPILFKKIEIMKDQPKANLSVLIKVLCAIPDELVEKNLMILGEIKNNYVQSILARELAYRFSRSPLSKDIQLFIHQFVLKEIEKIRALKLLSNTFQTIKIKQEFDSRIYIAKQTLLYLLIIEAQSEDIFALIPVILNGEKQTRAKSLELLILMISNRSLASNVLSSLLDDSIKLSTNDILNAKAYLDDWMIKVIREGEGASIIKEDANMEIMQKVFALRSVDLFKKLPGENLYLIADEIKVIEMHNGQRIFSQGDSPNGLYIVVSGNITIKKKNETIANLKKGDFFGELSLIDNGVRSASAIAASEGLLLFLDRENFDRIVNDIPEVLRSVTNAIMKYLRKYLV